MRELFANFFDKIKSKKEGKKPQKKIDGDFGVGKNDNALFSDGENFLTQDIFDFDEDKIDDVTTIKEIHELSRNGYRLLKAGSVDDAMFCFEKILELDPENNYALVGLGDAYRRRSCYDDALNAYKKVVDSSPKNVYALFGLACCYKAKHQHKKAIELYEAYSKVDPTNLVVLLRIADTYRKLKNFRSAKFYYKRVLFFDPENAYALIGIGYLYYDFRDYTQAIRYWEALMQNSESFKNLRLLTALGNCYRKTKAFDSALPYFLQALEIDEKNFYALFGIADCYRGLQQHKSSIEYWKRILEIESDNKVILTRLGDSYRNIGDLEAAYNAYQKALSLEYDAYAVLGLASIYKAKEAYSDVIDLINKYIDQDKKNYRFYVEIADCYLQQGDKEKALSTLRGFQKIGGSDSYIDTMIQRIKAGRV